MKPKKDISDLFRDNQHKLNESPSRQAWERLESRLDSHKDRNRTSIYRILSMAAAVVGLVVFASVITLVLRTNVNQMAMQDAMSEPFKTQELKVLTSSNENHNQIAAYQKKYDNHLSNPIMEGKANKKLIAKMDIERRDGNLNSFLAKARRENQKSMAITAPPPKAPTESLQYSPAGKVNVQNEDYAVSEELDAYDSPIPVEEKSSVEMATYGNADLAQDDVEKAEKAKEEAKDIAAMPMAKTKKRNANKASIAKVDQSVVSENLSRASTAAGQGNSSSSGIQQFQWLTGKWEGNVNNQVSVEQWNQVNNKTLEGRGSLMVDGQSTFHEDMKIQEKKGVIYFIADLNGTGNPINYQLISNDGFQAVFENQTIDFPNQVVLQRTNSSNFSTIYQNTQPGNIDETQQSYYLNRNYIQKEQVIRNLRRVND